MGDELTHGRAIAQGGRVAKARDGVPCRLLEVHAGCPDIANRGDLRNAKGVDDELEFRAETRAIANLARGRRPFEARRNSARLRLAVNLTGQVRNGSTSHGIRGDLRTSPLGALGHERAGHQSSERTQQEQSHGVCTSWAVVGDIA